MIKLLLHGNICLEGHKWLELDLRHEFEYLIGGLSTGIGSGNRMPPTVPLHLFLGSNRISPYERRGLQSTVSRNDKPELNINSPLALQTSRLA